MTDLRSNNDLRYFDEERISLAEARDLIVLPEQPTVELESGRDWLGILVALVIIILLAVQVILTSMLLARDTQVDIQFVPAAQTAPPPPLDA